MKRIVALAFWALWARESLTVGHHRIIFGMEEKGGPWGSSKRTNQSELLRIHPRLGFFGLFPVQHAARPVPPLWRGGSGRGSLERWQAPVDQGLHAVPGPL